MINCVSHSLDAAIRTILSTLLLGATSLEKYLKKRKEKKIKITEAGAVKAVLAVAAASLQNPSPPCPSCLALVTFQSLSPLLPSTPSSFPLATSTVFPSAPLLRSAHLNLLQPPSDPPLYLFGPPLSPQTPFPTAFCRGNCCGRCCCPPLQEEEELNKLQPANTTDHLCESWQRCHMFTKSRQHNIIFVLQEISKARQHQSVILNRPVLSTDLQNPALSQPLTWVSAHVEVNSLPAQQGAAASTAASTAASALESTQPAVVGIKREASDAQLTDQQPAKVAKFCADSHTAHPYGHAGTYHQLGLFMKPSPQEADPCTAPQTTHTLGHAEGQNHTASAQVILPKQLPVSTEQQMLEQRAARLSSEAKMGQEAPFSMHSNVVTMPMSPKWRPLPAVSPSGSTTAANAVPPAAPPAATACPVVPKSEGPPQSIRIAPPTEWNASILGSSSTSAYVPWQPQAASGGQSVLAGVKAEPQQLPMTAQDPKQMGTGSSGTWSQAAGAQMVKADPDAVLLGPRTEAQKAVPTNLESAGPVYQPWLQPGLPEASAVPDCTTVDEGRVWQPQGSQGQLVAPQLKVLHAGNALTHVNLQTSFIALRPSSPQLRVLSLSPVQ